MMKIKEDFSYEAFHSGIKCIISSLSQNRITRLTRWSQVDEAVRFLKNHSSTLERRAVIFDRFSILFLILQRRQLKFDSGHHVSFYIFFGDAR